MRQQTISYMQFLTTILVFAIKSITVLFIFQLSGIIWVQSNNTKEGLFNKAVDEITTN